MKARFPLYVKILLWFSINVLLLVGMFSLLLFAQFRLGLDWALAGGAGERIQAATDLIVGELSKSARKDWSAILQRHSNAYHIQFCLFENQGTQVAGDAIKLPVEVMARLDQLRFKHKPPGPPRDFGKDGKPPPLEDMMSFSSEHPEPPPDFPPRHMGRHRPPESRPIMPSPKAIVRTTHPTCYWLLVWAMIDDGKEDSWPQPVTLVVRSDTLSAGGLIFDSTLWLATIAGAIGLSVLLWLPLLRGITSSVAQITEATRRIAEGHFDVRVDEGRRDELGMLGQSINQMANRLAGLVTGQKRFLGDVAHELCSPLARLQVALGILEQRADTQQAPYVKTACDKGEQIAALVNELLAFSRASLGSSTIKLQPVPVVEVVNKAVEREQTEGTKFQIEVPANLCAQADPSLLERALANLLRNAIRYAGAAGPITITARREERTVLLSVADNGPGVPEKDLVQIFDPFYRVDSSRDRATGGVGLGLAIVKTCVVACGGSVACRNRKPAGFEVLVSLEASTN